ncbi:transcriptional regulator [Pandoraea faecigallinarum]|uniref:transcriptional regulator n=1 Tax=Pandoraea faecigallinarum TaxID=656179 RepID=UPI000A055C35|nr:YdaS family helix-turn-helix protein [Pandoraea faecigallinarum]
MIIETKTPLQVLELAVSHFASQAAFARAIGRRPQEVWNWLKRDKRAPIDACPFIEKACADHIVTCESLRPDYAGWAVARLIWHEDGRFGVSRNAETELVGGATGESQ